tara:strand:+ start:2451 stop:3035 length:585 start_codon:yes stop_codon:yes gene_type:complete
MNISINLFTKCPYTGNPKTRLSSLFTKSERTFISKYLLTSIIDEVGKLSLHDISRNIHVYPDVSKRFINSFKNLNDFNLIRQRGRNLNMRMLNCIKEQAQQAEKVLLFGSDIPGLTSKIIENGLRLLDSHDAVIGPATDGGYYLIGFKNFHEKYTHSINLQPENIRGSLSNNKLIFSELEQLSDIDYPNDLLII